MKNLNTTQALEDLVNIYKNFYESKELFSFKKLFKYSQEEIDEVFEYFTKNKENTKAKISKTSKSKKSLLNNIEIKEDAEKYYYENMIYDRNDEKAKSSIIDKHSADDLKKLFTLLYGTKPYGKKSIVFRDIQRYFENIERSKNL